MNQLVELLFWLQNQKIARISHWCYLFNNRVYLVNNRVQK